MGCTPRLLQVNPVVGCSGFKFGEFDDIRMLFYESKFEFQFSALHLFPVGDFVILDGRPFHPAAPDKLRGSAPEVALLPLPSYSTAAMASVDPVWERFVACKLSQASSFVSQNSENNSILGARSVNLNSGSIALNADAGTAGLMRDLAVKPVEEILSGKASQELASRNRYVRIHIFGVGTAIVLSDRVVPLTAYLSRVGSRLWCLAAVGYAADGHHHHHRHGLPVPTLTCLLLTGGLREAGPVVLRCRRSREGEKGCCSGQGYPGACIPVRVHACSSCDY